MQPPHARPQSGLADGSLPSPAEAVADSLSVGCNGADPIGPSRHALDLDVKRRLLNFWRTCRLNPEVEVHVCAGQVRLRGEVNSTQLKRLYVESCRSMTGVEMVIDEILVIEAPEAAGPEWMDRSPRRPR